MAHTRGLLLLAAIAFAACRVDVDPAGKACDDTHACQQGEVCFEGVCVIPCDPQLGQPCAVGQGACARIGIFRCEGLVLSCDAVPGDATAEVCDGVDNDCNGAPDDNLTPPACALTQGVCAAAAVTCQGEAGWSSCDYGADYEETEARCDRLDNDCDGTPDDVSGCVYTLVGHDGAPGRRDGPAANAQFSEPKYLAADSAGNLYLADLDNHQLRRISPDGTTTTIAGNGRCEDQDGPALSAGLCGPWGLWVSPDAGTIYFTEIYNDLVRKLENGQVTTIAGSGSQGMQNGAALNARFNEPYAVVPVPDGSGDLYIVDGHNHRIRYFDASAQSVSTWAGSGSSSYAEGTRLAMNLPHPNDLVIDPANGDFYVSEEIGTRIRVIPADGGVSWTLAGSTGGASGYVEGTGTAARFNEPFQLALDATTRTLYVADRGNHRIRAVALASGATRNVAGGWGFANGPAADARFQSPYGLALVNGALYVSDVNHVVRRVDPATGEVSDFAGLRAADRVKDGPVATAQTADVWGLALGPDGSIYWADTRANAVRVLRGGEVSTLVGSVTTPRWGHVDGPFSIGELDTPADLSFGLDGLLYLTEESNDGVRRLDLAAGQISTLAGPIDGSSGYADGPAASARFAGPYYSTVWDGGVFISDVENSLVRLVEESTGQTSTLAGTPGVFTLAEGPRGTGSFRELRAVAVDAAGNVYAADFQAIRKIAPDGTLSTLISGLPWQVTELQVDGNWLVYSIGGGLYRLNLSSPGFPVVLIDPHYGFSDGVIDQNAPNRAGIGMIEGLVVTPEYYLFTDGDGHRLRRLWR